MEISQFERFQRRSPSLRPQTDLRELTSDEPHLTTEWRLQTEEAVETMKAEERERKVAKKEKEPIEEDEREVPMDQLGANPLWNAMLKTERLKEPPLLWLLLRLRFPTMDERD